MMKNKFIALIVIPLGLTTGCNSVFEATKSPKKVSGTITYQFEDFSFSPSGNSESYWINSDSNNANDWNIFSETLRLADKHKEARAEGALVPTIYICIEGHALVKPHKDGVGHLNLWKSDITFTEISSAKIGACED